MENLTLFLNKIFSDVLLTREIISRSQFIKELGTVREVVSRLLKQLEKEHKVINHRGKIEIIEAL